MNNALQYALGAHGWCRGGAQLSEARELADRLRKGAAQLGVVEVSAHTHTQTSALMRMNATPTIHMKAARHNHHITCTQQYPMHQHAHVACHTQHTHIPYATI